MQVPNIYDPGPGCEARAKLLIMFLRRTPRLKVGSHSGCTYLDSWSANARDDRVGTKDSDLVPLLFDLV